MTGQPLTISSLMGSCCTSWVDCSATELVLDVAGAVEGLGMSSCRVCASWRSSRGKGVGIAVASRGSGDWETSLGRSMVAILPLYEMCVKEWQSPSRPVTIGVREEPSGTERRGEGHHVGSRLD